MPSASVSVIGEQQNFVGVISRKKRHLLRALSGSSVLEKRLLLATFALFAIALALLIALIVAGFYRRSKDKGKACESKECIRSAAMLVQSIDTSVDPCDDFYRFACGNWASARLLPDAPTSWFSERTKFLQQKVIEILQGNSSSTDPKPVRQARTFYKACVDADMLDELGVEPMLEVLERVRLPRAMPDAASAAGWRLGRSLAAVQRALNSDILVTLSTYNDPATNTSILMVSPSYSYSSLPEVVSSPEVGEARLTGGQLFKARLSYVTEVLGELAPDANATKLVTLALRILVTDAHIKTDIRRSETEETPLVTTYRKLQQTMDNARNSTLSDLKLDWAEYLDTLFAGLNVTINVNSPVAVHSPAYFEAFARRLSNSRRETIQRFVWWKVVESMAPHTTTALRRIRDNFVELLFGPSTRTTRVKRCGKITKSFFNYAISYVMATENSLAESSKKVEEMLQDIAAAFGGLVRSLDWMDAGAKRETLAKAAAMRRFVGYPDWLLKTGELDKLYENITIEKDAFLKNMLSIKDREVREVLGSLGSRPANQTDLRWDSDPIEVNAYYSRTINAISIPAGILQMPFYFLGMEALNYGAIGSILGHELTHGFDIEGKDYDKKGEKQTWWSSRVTDVFNSKAECFVDQYGKFSFGNSEDLRVNGSLTLAENIADNGGIREALLGYRLYTSRSGAERPLPGLQRYSHEQLLFLAFANVWCEVTTPAHDVMSLTDSHSPNRFRVLGSLSNSPEFAAAWSCPPGSPMNPPSKCILW